MADTGNLFVVAAPSGAGKTSLVKALVESMPSITVSISHTTRPKRPLEEHGKNYYFIDKTEFENMITHHDFLEHAVIFDHLYGTSKRWVQQTLASGLDVILEIDWQGHQQIKQLFPQSISIFILPPSLQALQERLKKRNQDAPEIIQKRLADARKTISHIPEFDYLVVNDDFEIAKNELKIIVEATRLQQPAQSKTYAGLIAEFAAY